MATASPATWEGTAPQRRDAAVPVAVPWSALGVLTLLALALRVVRLDSGLWVDEMYALVASFRPPLGTIITSYWGDTHHPLYAVLARICIVLFGESAWSIRLPAVAFGAASIPLVYLLGRRVADGRVAMWAAVLLAASYHHVWFSQNARGYTMMAFFATASTLMLLRALDGGSRRDFVHYALLAALGAYTHLTMVFVAVGHAVVAAVEVLRPSRPSARLSWQAPLVGFGLAAVFTVLLYAPMLDEVIGFFLHHQSTMRGVSTPSWALTEAIRGLIVGFGAAKVAAGAVVLALGLAFGVTGFVSLLLTNRNAALAFSLPALVMVGGALAGRGTMYPRFFFFLIGIALVVGVHGVFVAARWLARLVSGASGAGSRLAHALCLALLAAFAASLPFNYRFPKQDFVGAMRHVQSSMAPGDRVVFTGVPGPLYANVYGVSWPTVTTLEEIEAARAGRGRTWLIYTFPRIISHSQPAVASLIERECQHHRVFRGTVGGGDVMVCALEGT